MDVYASTQDRDLGAVAADTDKILEAFDNQLPRGTRLVMRGQVSTMRSSFLDWVRDCWRDRSRVSADRGEFPVLAGSLHHHHGFAGSACGNLLVPAARRIRV